ncbi:MAG: YraN family protein [Acidimicrobiia bacterium]|nr:YraN family protein [Acidimicrobiia bacterium]
MHNNNFGRWGEDAASRWYKQAGYRILERNWRCAQGEIDLVVASGSAVTFVEVKARTSGRYGSGFDAVDRRKQQRLRQLARRWLSDRPPPSRGQSPEFFDEVHFDVVEVDGQGRVRVRQQCF